MFNTNAVPKGMAVHQMCKEDRGGRERHSSAALAPPVSLMGHASWKEPQRPSALALPLFQSVLENSLPSTWVSQLARHGSNASAQTFQFLVRYFSAPEQNISLLLVGV